MTILFPDELEHLRQTNRKLEDAIERAEASVEKLGRDYMDTKRYMAEYRGEIDPHEMFQTELLLKQTDHTGAYTSERRDRLVKLKESPYFGRIDFQEHSGGEPVPYYVGRFGFHYDNEPVIFDWRAPVSSMFYDCEVGPAGFQSPAGQVDGELTRKRQFKIQNGRNGVRAGNLRQRAGRRAAAGTEPYLGRQDEIHHFHDPERAEPDHPQ